QTGSTRGNVVSGLVVALAPFAQANHVAYGVFGVASNVLAVTPGAGFTEISEQPSGETIRADLQAEWAPNDNTIDASWAPSMNAGALGVEIKAATGAGPGVDAAQSTVSAAPNPITAGSGMSTITVTVRDGTGAPVSGATVGLAATGSGNTLTPPAGPTDANGVATGTLSSTVAGDKTVSATANGTTITQTAVVTVNPGPVSAAQSTVSAAPSTIAAGTETSTITVTAKDANGNRISGATVGLAATGSGNTVTQPGGPTDVNGVATGTLRSTVEEAKTVSATVNGTLITQTATVTVTTATAIFVGAGDISSCGNNNDEATAALLDNIAGTVFTAGDNVYPDGTEQQFATCYDPTWGRHRARTQPSAGNHDYHTTQPYDAAGYFRYFGAAAGDSTQGYYSYDLGSWHIIALNSNISMSVDSAQEQWLRADLAASQKTCTLAYWHHPRFSSGSHGNSNAPLPLWQALYDANADLILVGHDHDYERFAPQTPAGAADPVRGIRQFVIGTGGADLRGFRATPMANSEVRNSDTFGVLKLTLHATGYNWEFVPVAGQTFTDSGSGACH
ncbi:MAG TPA: invasin domain 3-containing protein, partial [Gemmatimonadales bacterium]|nr:invasin domain 3-containing protein [Gemmatimonadales bacterium]